MTPIAKACMMRIKMTSACWTGETRRGDTISDAYVVPEAIAMPIPRPDTIFPPRRELLV
jgi:hypothetical protein